MYCKVNVCESSPVMLISKPSPILAAPHLVQAVKRVLSNIHWLTWIYSAFFRSRGRERGAIEETHQDTSLPGAAPKHQGSLGNDLNSAVLPASTLFCSVPHRSDVPTRKVSSFEQRHISSWQFRDNPAFSGPHD